MKNNCAKIYKKLLKANDKFLQLVQDKFSAQIIVGSLSYGRYSLLKETSDLDCIFICPRNSIYDSIKSSYFNNIVDARIIKDLIERNKIDYIKLKFDFEGVEFNVEIVPEEFLYKICTYDLVSNLSQDNTKCYINYQPGDHYLTSDFCGRKVMIKYDYVKIRDGYILDLPIHHVVEINSQNFYSYGFLVIKLLTPWLVYGDYKIKNYLDMLFTNVANRFKYERERSQENYINLKMSNLFIRELPHEMFEAINECAEGE